ncbi:hypothetical protein [Shigella phage ESh2]|nr:hypothetical protein [Shigella phage ESh2]
MGLSLSWSFGVTLSVSSCPYLLQPPKVSS